MLNTYSFLYRIFAPFLLIVLMLLGVQLGSQLFKNSQTRQSATTIVYAAGCPTGTWPAPKVCKNHPKPPKGTDGMKCDVPAGKAGFIGAMCDGTCCRGLTWRTAEQQAKGEKGENKGNTENGTKPEDMLNDPKGQGKGEGGGKGIMDALGGLLKGLGGLGGGGDKNKDKKKKENQLKPPVCKSISVSPSRPLRPGESATLTWILDGGRPDAIIVTPGVGVVRGFSVRVTPEDSTTYTVTARNKNGNSSCKRVRVYVGVQQNEVDENVGSIDNGGTYVNNDIDTNGDDGEDVWIVDGEDVQKDNTRDIYNDLNDIEDSAPVENTDSEQDFANSSEDQYMEFLSSVAGDGVDDAGLQDEQDGVVAIPDVIEESTDEWDDVLGDSSWETVDLEKDAGNRDIMHESGLDLDVRANSLDDIFEDNGETLARNTSGLTNDEVYGTWQRPHRSSTGGLGMFSGGDRIDGGSQTRTLKSEPGIFTQIWRWVKRTFCFWCADTAIYNMSEGSLAALIGSQRSSSPLIKVMARYVDVGANQGRVNVGFNFVDTKCGVVTPVMRGKFYWNKCDKEGAGEVGYMIVENFTHSKALGSGTRSVPSYFSIAIKKIKKVKRNSFLSSFLADKKEVVKSTGRVNFSCATNSPLTVPTLTVWSSQFARDGVFGYTNGGNVYDLDEIKAGSRKYRLLEPKKYYDFHYNNHQDGSEFYIFCAEKTKAPPIKDNCNNSCKADKEICTSVPKTNTSFSERTNVKTSDEYKCVEILKISGCKPACTGSNVCKKLNGRHRCVAKKTVKPPNVNKNTCTPVCTGPSICKKLNGRYQCVAKKTVKPPNVNKNTCTPVCTGPSICAKINNTYKCIPKKHTGGKAPKGSYVYKPVPGKKLCPWGGEPHKLSDGRIACKVTNKHPVGQSSGDTSKLNKKKAQQIAEKARRAEHERAQQALDKQRDAYQKRLAAERQKQQVLKKRMAQAQKKKAQQKPKAAQSRSKPPQKKQAQKKDDNWLKRLLAALKRKKDDKFNLPPIVAKPQCAAFIVDKTKINPGEEITLSWTVTGATELIITPKVRVVEIGGKRVAKANPQSSVQYTLIAKNSKGEEHRCQTHRVMVAEDGVTDPGESKCKKINSVHIGMSPRSIIRPACDPELSGEKCDESWKGKLVKLDWNVSPKQCVTHCKISNQDGDIWTSPSDLKLMKNEGMLREASTFSISCEDGYGNLKKDSVSATVRKQ